MNGLISACVPSATQVRLLDVGCVRVVDVNQLLTLPEHFLRIPAQVVEAYICGVKPWDRDQDWPEDVRGCVSVWSEAVGQRWM